MIIVLPLQDLKNKMWVLWYWSKFLSFEEKATFVISCQTFWGYLPNLVATEDDASQPLNLKSFFRVVSVKFVVFFLIALSASQIFILEGDCLDQSLFTISLNRNRQRKIPTFTTLNLTPFLCSQNPEAYQGLISVSGQLPTYPSPNPTLTLTCYQLTVVELGEG